MRWNGSPHRRRWRAGSLTLVVVLLAAGGVLVGRSVRDQRAQEALTNVLVTGRVPGRSPETIRRLELLIDDYRGSRAAWVAHAHLAELCAEDGRFLEARTHWRRLVEGGPGDLAASAEMNLIRLDRAEGRFEELANRLENLIEKGGSSLPDDVLLFELAETFEQLGRHEEARRIKRFEEVVPETPRILR